MTMNVINRVKNDKAILALTAAMTLALIVTLVILIAVWRGATDRRQIDNAESDALDAAQTYAVAMTSYNYKQLDKDFAWIDDSATASFAKQYREANKPLRSIIEKLKATATGNVTDAAATAESQTSVRVLMFIDQSITNQANAENRDDRSRVVMMMVKRDGKWLLDDVQLR